MRFHTTHSLYSQYRFGAISRISAIATPALLAQGARKHAAHTTARSPARAHRGCPKSPSGSTLAARNPSIRSLVAASSPRGACTRPRAAALQRLLRWLALMQVPAICRGGLRGGVGFESRRKRAVARP